MDAIDRMLRERLHIAGAEMSERPLRADAALQRRSAPPRNLRPLLAAVVLALMVGGVAGGLGLHSRLSARQTLPAATPPPAPVTPAPSTPAPTPSFESAPFLSSVRTAAWDSTHRQVVAFAPSDVKGGEAAGRIWTWDGKWQERSGPGGPGINDDGILVDAPVLHGVVLLGHDPVTTAGSTWGGSWAWDGAWHKLPAADFGMCLHPTTAAWDQRRHNIVLVVSNGCSGGNQPIPSETWTFDGRVWLRRGVLPDAAFEPTVAWDGDASTVVLLGLPHGGSTTNNKARAWTWTGKAWTAGAAAIIPFPQLPLGAAWDARSKAVVLFGQAGGDGKQPARTLAVHGGTWSEPPLANYPDYVDAIVAADGHLLAIGTEPVSVTQTPAPTDRGGGYYLLAWTGSTWAHITYAELSAP
jgi:hypothetical protein